MTDKFTLEEIEAAVRKTQGRFFETGSDMENAVKTVLAELTKPRVEFAEGEVFFYEYLENDQPTGAYFIWRDGEFTPKTGRKLTTKEAGAGELVKALERIGNLGNGYPARLVDATDLANSALAQWRGDRDE